jgi:hypothetical protein
MDVGAQRTAERVENESPVKATSRKYTPDRTMRCRHQGARSGKSIAKGDETAHEFRDTTTLWAVHTSHISHFDAQALLRDASRWRSIGQLYQAVRQRRRDQMVTTSILMVANRCLRK